MTGNSQASQVNGDRDERVSYVVILGMMIAVGPLGIDMYLPAFPAIATSLHTSVALVQVSLVSYFIALAVGQLIYGPLSDRFGRKRVVVTGIALFTLTTIGICATSNIAVLIALRIIEGLGGCAGTVIARSIVRDLASGQAAAKLFSRMILIFGVAPILAPVLGSALMLRFPWTAIFWFLALYGAMMFVLVLTVVPETHPPALRSVHLSDAFRAYWRCLQDRRYCTVVAIGSLMQGAFFAYLTGSPFAYMKIYGVSSIMYSILFGSNAIALISGSQSSPYLIRLLGPQRLIVVLAAVASISTVMLYIATVYAHVPLPWVLVGIGVLIVCQGIMTPTTTMLALEEYPHAAGAASALMGTALYGGGAIASMLVTMCFDTTMRPMIGCMAIATTAAFLLAWRLARTKPGERIVNEF